MDSRKTVSLTLFSEINQIFCEDPIIDALQNISRSRLRKSRSTLSVLRLKKSYIKLRCLKNLYLRSCASKSPDSTSTSYSKSVKVTATYILDGRKCGRTSQQSNKSSKPSVYSSLASFGSTSPRSGSSISRSSYSTPKRSYSGSLVSVKHKKGPYRHSCLQSFDSNSHHIIKPCLKSPAKTRSPSKIPVKTSCVKSQSKPRTKASLLKSFCSPTLPNKLNLRSPTSKSPNIKPGTLPGKLPDTKQIPNQRSCLKSSIWKLLNRKPSASKPNCNYLDSFPKSSQPANRNSKYSTPEHVLSKSPESKPPPSKSPPSTSISFKAADTKLSRSSVQVPPQPKTPKSKPVYSKASNKKADLIFFHSIIPKNKTPRFTLRSQFISSARPFPKQSQQVTATSKPIYKKSSQEKSLSEDLSLPLPNLKLRHLNRLPRLTASKIHVSKLSLKRSQCLKGPLLASDRRRQSSKSMVKLWEYVVFDPKAKLPRPKKTSDYLEHYVTTKVDVLYMTELKNYFDKIKSAFTYGGPEYKALQLKRHNHRTECHQGPTTSSRDANEGNPNVRIPINVENSDSTKAKHEYWNNIGNAKRDIENAIRGWVEKIPIQVRPENQYQKEETIRRLINNITRDRNRYEDGVDNATSLLKLRQSIAIQIDSNIEDSNTSGRMDNIKTDSLVNHKNPRNSNLLNSPSNASYLLKQTQINNLQRYNKNTQANDERTNSNKTSENPSFTQIQERIKTDIRMDGHASYASSRVTQTQSYQHSPKTNIRLSDNINYEYTGHIPDNTGQYNSYESPSVTRNQESQDRPKSNVRIDVDSGYENFSVMKTQNHQISLDTNIKEGSSSYHNSDITTRYNSYEDIENSSVMSTEKRSVLSKTNIEIDDNPSYENLSVTQAQNHKNSTEINIRIGDKLSYKCTDHNYDTATRYNSYEYIENTSVMPTQKRPDRSKTYISIDDNPSYEDPSVTKTQNYRICPDTNIREDDSSSCKYTCHNPDNICLPKQFSSKGENYQNKQQPNKVRMLDSNFSSSTTQHYKETNDPSYRENDHNLQHSKSFINTKNFVPKNSSNILKNHNIMDIPNIEHHTDPLNSTKHYSSNECGNSKDDLVKMNRNQPKRDKSKESSLARRQCIIKTVVENVITHCFQKCNFNSSVNKQEVIDEIITNISPYLHNPRSTIHYSVIKKMILDVFEELGLSTTTAKSKKSERLVDELSNRLIGVVSRKECSGKYDDCGYDLNIYKPFKSVANVHVAAEILRQELMEGDKISNIRNVLEKIANIICNKLDYFCKVIDDPNDTRILRNDSKIVFENDEEHGDAEVESIISLLMKNTKEEENMIATINNRTSVTSGHCLTKPVSIMYTSEHDITPSFAIPNGSSTPKKKKEVSKQSEEEKAYSDDIVTVLREWIQNKPTHFKNLDDDNMNEVMMYDLAGELVDQAKLDQLVITEDKETLLMHYILKWIMKFEIVDDLKEAAPYATVLLKKLTALHVPVLTKPHHGTRQTLKNLKLAEDDYFVPEAQDILEDEISIWMNEYPSDIYAYPDKSVQNKLVHEFANKLMDMNKPDIDYGKEINDWLKTVLKPSEKNRIDSMSTSLSSRISKLPTHETIVSNEIKKARQLLEKQMYQDDPEISQAMIEENENDDTMKEFIVKYVEHRTDEDDPLAKAAYVKLLTSELRRLSPNIIEELKEGTPLERFAPHRLFMELQYIKDISDWLKTLPIDPNFNKVGNKNRIEFIINFAKEINNIEEERLQTPDAMNFDDMIISTVFMYMRTIPLRVPPCTRINEYGFSLCRQIFLKREENMPVIPEDQLWGNIADFLDDFIRLNGNDIVDDEAKVEVWAARLLNEIKKMISENPYTLPRADLNDRLAGVAKPGDETVKRFNHELDYAKEISDWLKNFPLIDSVDVEIIRDLAEKMAESENDIDENNLVTYINQWISNLPLDITKQIDIPFVIQQLLNRRNKIVEDKSTKLLVLSEPKTSPSREVRDQKESVKALCRGCCPVDDPGSIIVQIINNWCDKLPLVGAKDDTKNTKTILANKLHQKVMEINNNPKLVCNDILYMESLLESIDDLLENLPHNINIEGNKEEFKSKLFDDLRQGKIFIKEISLGDEYMKDLEDAVESALPNTASKTPGDAAAFEMYKENLIDKFILDNFDHSTDNNSQKYKKKIQNEINKYAFSAQQRKGRAVPINELNNEIRCVLFDVKMPVENALQDNVEEIKTKCDIDEWVQTLPLKPISGPVEALHRDRKIKLLARKIHILEFEKNSEHKIFNEVRKWLAKSLLIREQEEIINKFADYLQEILNNSRENRKFVPASAVQESVFEPADEDNSIWVNPNITTDQYKIREPATHKTADILLEIVEVWSKNIPFPSNVVPSNQISAIKDDIMVQIIKKISELNSSPHIFNNDKLYNHLMNQEIENALSRVPQNNTLTQMKPALKYQLTSAIESVKPLIRAERARYQYRKELNTTVKNFLGSLENPTADDKMLLDKITEEIVDDFLEYQYNKNDEEGKEFYKNKMVKALTQYNIIGEKEENINEVVSDTLVETNRLICELLKVKAPENMTMKDEVEEIRMKHEVTNFLDKVAPPSESVSSPRRTALRDSLTKQLHGIEKTGHTNFNNAKMAAVVSRTLKRLGEEDKDNEIQNFIEKLQNNEPIRKAPVNSSISIQDQGFQVEVQASFYRPDYVPPNWVPPPKPPSSSLEQIIICPRKSLAPSSGPIGSILRSTQTAQTPIIGPAPQNAQFPGQCDQRACSPFTAVQGQPGQLQGQPGQPGQLQWQPGQLQGPPGQLQGQPGQLQGQPRQLQGQPGQLQGLPGLLRRKPAQQLKQTRIAKHPSSNAGVQTDRRLASYICDDDETCDDDDDSLCALCRVNPCEFYDCYEDCDDTLRPKCRRPMMYPPMMMMCPPYNMF